MMDDYWHRLLPFKFTGVIRDVYVRHFALVFVACVAWLNIVGLKFSIRCGPFSSLAIWFGSWTKRSKKCVHSPFTRYDHNTVCCDRDTSLIHSTVGNSHFLFFFYGAPNLTLLVINRMMRRKQKKFAIQRLYVWIKRKRSALDDGGNNESSDVNDDDDVCDDVDEKV